MRVRLADYPDTEKDAKTGNKKQTWIVSLPEYCKVLADAPRGRTRDNAPSASKSEDREYFTIAEGFYKGRKASIKSGNLVLAPGYLPAATVYFFPESKVLSWKGGPQLKAGASGVVGGISAFTSANNPVPFGEWDVEIPDCPHDLAQPYVKYATHALTWFHILTGKSKYGKEDRYLHCGAISTGCATVGQESVPSAVAVFEGLYAYLIRRRLRPGIVGKIQVMPG